MRHFYPLLLFGAMASFALAQDNSPDSVAVDPPQPVQVELDSNVIEATPGSDIAFTVNLKIAEEFHIAGADDLDGPLSIELSNTDPVFSLVPPKWPASHSYEKAGQVVPILEGNHAIKVRLKLAEDAPLGTHAESFTLWHMACSGEVCFLPEKVDLPFSVEVVSGPPVKLQDEPAVELPPVETKDPPPAKATAQEENSGFFAVNGFWSANFVAYIGGIVLFFFPCVLSTVPLKIAILQKYAGSRMRLLFDVLVTIAGQMAVLGSIGVLISLVSSIGSVGFLFEMPLFTLAIGLFNGYMALALLEIFSINPPSFLQPNPLKENSLSSTFKFGMYAAIMSTPCSAPLLGTASAWAIQQNAPFTALTVFCSMAAGLGTPFFLAVLFPGLLRKLPRSGDWSDLLKQGTSGFTMAVAVWYASTGILSFGFLRSFVLSHKVIAAVLPFWLITTVVVATCAWIIYRTWRLTTLTPSQLKRWGWRVVVLTLFGTGILYVSSRAVSLTEREREVYLESEKQSLDAKLWQPYSAAAVAKAKAEGKVILIEFTSPVCLNCKFLEIEVLHTDEVRQALQENDVAAFVCDVWEEDGAELLLSLEERSTPLLVVYGPGLDGGLLKSHGYTVTTIQDFIRQAKGE